MTESPILSRRDFLKANFSQETPPTCTSPDQINCIDSNGAMRMEPLSPEQQKSLEEALEGIQRNEKRKADATATAVTHDRQQSERRAAGAPVSSGESVGAKCMALPGVIMSSFLGLLKWRGDRIRQIRAEDRVQSTK